LTCPQLGFVDLLLRVARAVREHPVMAVLAASLTLGGAVFLSVFGPHPFIDVNRVSMPYGVRARDLGLTVVATAFVALAAGTAPFLTVRVLRRYVRVVSYVVLVTGLAAAAVSVLRLQRLAYVLISLYVVGVPLAKVTYVALAAVSVIVGALILRKVLREAHHVLRVRNLTRVDGEGLPLGDALLAWLTAFIILMIPYYPWINPKGIYADVDHIYYWRWLQGTDWGNVWVRLLAFGRGDRPLFVGFVFLATRVMPFHAFDVLYVAGAGALVTVLAEGVARRAGLGKWFGFTASLLGSIPLYFVFGGYHANLAAMCLTLATLYWRLGWRGVGGDGALPLRRLALLAIASLLTAMTHSEAWILYIPLFALDAPTLIAWVIGGGSWLFLREALIPPEYAKLAGNLLAKGAPSITDLDLQLVVMLWGVPAMWLTYVLATGGILRAWKSNTIRKYASFLASTSLTLIPLLTLTPRFMVHRVLMNTAYWFFTAYALSRAWGSRKWEWVVPLYIGLQSIYVVWLLSNTVPVK